jgi:D-glycero-D-manno-heptose 1,7-bisphosphate phosphatase
MQRALLLDRDGVINADHGYVFQQSEFRFIDGIFELCRFARQQGFLVLVVTNQAGIGRGYYTEEDFLCLTAWMCQIFVEAGAPIEKVYFCPTHPEHGLGEYRRVSAFRKPGPGMILQAAREYGLDLGASVLVGDKESDMLAGAAAGVGCNLLFLPEGGGAHAQTVAHQIIQSLSEVRPFLRQCP